MKKTPIKKKASEEETKENPDVSENKEDVGNTKVEKKCRDTIKASKRAETKSNMKMKMMIQ